MFEESIVHWAAFDPERVALRFAVGAGDDSFASWTYQELLACVRCEADALAQSVSGVLPVAIVMAPCGPSVAALIAALGRRNPAILIPPNSGDAELTELLDRSPAKAVFAESASNTAGWRKLDRLPGPALNDALFPAGVAIAQLTSGSTGPSRLALRTHVALSLEVAAVTEVLGLTERDNIVCMSAISHSYGLLGGLLAPLSAGATVVLARSALDLSPLALRPPPTVMFALGSTYTALLSTESDIDLTLVRWALSAGAPLTAGLFDDFQSRYCLPIRQDYGTTETGTISIDTGYPPSPATVGRVLPHLEVRVDATASVPVGEQEQGEMLVRGRAVAESYFGTTGVQAVLDHDGWYHTRDRGSLDESGHLRVGHRVRDPIALPGIQLHPESVEALMADLSGVSECVVVPARPGAGPSKIRIIVVAADLDESAIRRYLQLMLPEVEPVTEIAMLDALPRSPAGKILQKYLI